MNTAIGTIDWVLMLLAAICFAIDGFAITVVKERPLRFFSFGFMFIALTFVL